MRPGGDEDKDTGKVTRNVVNTDKNLLKKGPAQIHTCKSGVIQGSCAWRQEALFERDEDLAQPQYQNST